MIIVIKLLFAFALVDKILTDSPVGDVVGKLTVGYQGWFACKGDASPRNRWVHWVDNSDHPYKAHQKFEIWPDVREYTHTYETGYANLGNGEKAKLFSSWDDQTVDTHFKWMQQNNIDVAALQRFAGGIKKDPVYGDQLNGIAKNVMRNAEKHNRKFYIMWDISGWTNFSTELIEDYNNNIVKKLNLLKSTAYAHQNGKPVVCIWGFGFNDRPDDPKGALTLIKYLKSQGLYVIGGTPRHWRAGTDTRKGFQDVFLALNMLSPWSVGSFKGVNEAADYQNDLKGDHEYLSAHNVDYQPVLFPGFGWSNWNHGPVNEMPRLHGDFMWQQFVNIRELGIKNSYVAMFDEYDEGTAIAKAAENKSMIPTDQYFLTLDADGVRVSSDFYLRLVGDGNRMMKGDLPLQKTHPTKHVV